MKNFSWLIVFVLMLVGTFVPQAFAYTIDFEGITTQYASMVPDKYGKMNWPDTAVTAVLPEGPSLNPNYWAFGIDSNPIEFYSENKKFTLESFKVMSGMQIPGMDFSIEGFLDGSLAFVENGAIAGVSGDYALTSSEEIDHVRIWTNNPFFFLLADDIEIKYLSASSAVPEPGTAVLFFSGLLVLTRIPRRKT